MSRERRKGNFSGMMGWGRSRIGSDGMDGCTLISGVRCSAESPTVKSSTHHPLSPSISRVGCPDDRVHPACKDVRSCRISDQFLAEQSGPAFSKSDGCTKKCRFMEKRVREISCFFVAPPARRACFPSPSARVHALTSPQIPPP